MPDSRKVFSPHAVEQGTEIFCAVTCITVAAQKISVPDPLAEQPSQSNHLPLSGQVSD
ncbi:hypothetical protein ACFVIB_31730 [Streptomyces nigra]|uniref:hypothetical protein n=1 Tax=Streptomyces nigra TaxID=1827580 RepID=UPI003629BF90